MLKLIIFYTARIDGQQESWQNGYCSSLLNCKSETICRFESGTFRKVKNEWKERPLFEYSSNDCRRLRDPRHEGKCSPAPELEQAFK